jgi:uncharacterized protein YndB with AHSA1/START domain
VTTMIDNRVATQVYQVYIKASPQVIWDAITKSEWTQRYGYGGRVDYELEPGGAYRAYSTDAMRAMSAPEVIVDGKVVEADAPRRLVQTWKAHFGEQSEAESPTRLTYEIADAHPGVTKLTVTHELEGAPSVAAYVTGSIPDAGGGWPFVLSDLKTLLETGNPLADC